MLASALAGACGTEPEGSAESGNRVASDSATLDPAADERVAYLLAPCAKGGYYGVATADVLPILEETLLHGHRDPLKRAKAELGGMGEPGLQVLRRVVRANWNVPDGKNHVRNALEAAAMGAGPGVRLLLLEGLGHPKEDLRLVSLRGLRRHGLPADYDAMFNALAMASAPFYGEVIGSMHAVAPMPTEALILGWLERGEYREIWDQLVPLVGSVQAPELVERCRALWPEADPHFRPSLAAPCARAGDVEALRALQTWLVDPLNATLRRYTAMALNSAGMFELLPPMLAGDPDANNRLIAAGFMTETDERTRALRSELLAGMGDSESDVALACARGLIRIGEASAIDLAVRLLSETGPDSLRDGMRLLLAPMQEDPALAERAFEVLRERNEAEAHRPLEERQKVLQILGQVPLEQAALYLHEQSFEAQGQRLQGLRGERWFMMQIGNVGPAATPLLESLLDEPLGQVRRIDVLEALSSKGGDAGRANMLRFLEREDAQPLEVLYAADRLVRIGPASVVAPVLKRTTLRVSDPRVRPALQCLLWMAYPGPS